MAKKKPSSVISKKETSPATKQDAASAEQLPGFIGAAGTILAISYPVLALSTGMRSIYQLLFKEGVTDYLPPALSGVAAFCYLLAAIGFTYRVKWGWKLSVSVLAFETFMTLVVGTLSFTHPELIGRTVWRHFGADYGYFPLVQPLIGLVWLFWPATVRAYGIHLPFGPWRQLGIGRPT
jgi:hypothetical protein